MCRRAMLCFRPALPEGPVAGGPHEQGSHACAAAGQLRQYQVLEQCWREAVRWPFAGHHTVGPPNLAKCCVPAGKAVQTGWLSMLDQACTFPAGDAFGALPP